MDWCFKHDRSFNDFTVCPDCLHEMLNELIVLRSLVREMGLFTRDVFNHQLPKLGGDYIWSLHRQAEEILNHSEVKKIMGESDHADNP